MFFLELHQKVGDHLCRRKDRKLHRRLCEIARVFEFLLHLIELFQKILCMLQKDVPITRQTDISPLVFEERHLQLLLQPAYGAGQGRLRDVQLLCRLRQMLQFRGLLEILKRREIEFHIRLPFKETQWPETDDHGLYAPLVFKS